jgi:hypothetical protein
VDLLADVVAAPRRRRATWTNGVAAVVLVFAVAACGDDDESPSPSGQDAEPVVLEVTIAEGKVSPSGEQIEAAVGQPIEIRVDSDAPDSLHVHSSPEHEYEVEAAEDQVFTFSIDTPGQVEIETHETDTVVAELEVS